jgi:methanogenic corrinoid protein MtbC1
MAIPAQRNTNQLEQLAMTIEAEIVPRLLMAHASRTGRQPSRPTPTDVAEFTRLILQHDADVGLTYSRVLLGRGCSPESILLELLAPAARTLGELWDADAASFTEVTVAMGRLQQVLQNICPALRRAGGTAPGSRRAILAPAPGEQHTLGVTLVAEFLRRDEWDVLCDPKLQAADLGDLVHDQWFAVAGLSLSSPRQFDGLVDVVALIRGASRNPNIAVLVGGPFFVDNPGLLPRTGADAMASDASQAAVTAAALQANRPDEHGRIPAR